MDVHINSLDITSLRDISHIRSKSQFTNLNKPFSPDYLPNELIHLNIYYIEHTVTYPEAQTIGSFNKRHIKRFSMWYEWEKGEIKQLKQIHDLGMFGKHIYYHKNDLGLITH